MEKQKHYAKYAGALYGETGYAQGQSAGEQDESYADLMRYLPPYWHEIREMIELQRTMGIEIENLNAGLSDLERQCYLETATWGLSFWEREYGLPTDVKKSHAFRRERIRSKMRGSGTTTKQMIVNIASAFAGGEAEVLEYPNESRFLVKFIGIKGVPANMEDLAAAIEEIKPAHLAFDFAYTYNWWDTLKGKAWNDLRTHTWEQARTV